MAMNSSSSSIDTRLPAQPDHAPPVPSEALGAVMTLTCLISLALLILSPLAAKPLPHDRRWFLAPVNWPALALVTMAVTSGVLALPFVRGWWRGNDGAGLWRHARWAFSGMPVDLVYGALFCGYLVLLNYVGFALGTWIFAQICVTLSGLRGAKWWLATLAFTAALVAILRVGMSLWFPQAVLFDHLPHGLGLFCSRYL